MRKRQHECITRLINIGVSSEDAAALRIVAMALQRWHELECGNSDDAGSWCVARGHLVNGKFEYDDNGKPFREYHSHRGNAAVYTPMQDSEAGAMKKLRAIMERYTDKSLQFYVQGDPRGAPLYILRPGDIPHGESVDAFYNRGIAVYK